MSPPYSKYESSDENSSHVGSEDGSDFSGSPTDIDVGNTYPVRSRHYLENPSNFQINGGLFGDQIHNHYGNGGVHRIAGRKIFTESIKGFQMANATQVGQGAIHSPYQPEERNTGHLQINGGHWGDEIHIYHGETGAYGIARRKYFTEFIKGFQTLTNAIKDSQDAIHDAHHPEDRECFPETRRTTLKAMIDWVVHRPSGPGILWLSGPAGVGKTAIARTLCKELQAKDIIVGGGFFFSRNKPHKATLMFPTLAYQLAERIPNIGNRIGDKVAKDPLISGKDLDIQLSELILAPLQSFSSSSPIVFVIDGLDECENEKSQCKIIDVIQNAINDNPHHPLRFVITSRPEKWIKDQFASTTHVIPLEETAETKEDIRKYLAHGFDKIYEKRGDIMRKVTRPWPSVHEMTCLVEKASGQFIYASTILKHVGDDENSPVERLKNILNVGGELDELYTQILEKVKVKDRTRDVLAGLLLVSSDAYRNEILSILEILFEFESGSGYSALHHLHSVLDIQKIREDPGANTQYAVHIHHKSFAEFLTSKTRSNDFFIDTEAYHARLAIGCTRILMRLQASADRPSFIAWDYATMRLSYHCQQSVVPTPPNLIAALQELDVSASLLPILLKTDSTTLQDAEPKIRKKCRSRSRSTSAKGLTTSDEAITAAMNFLSANNLTCSFSVVHDGLLDLQDWLEGIKYKPLSRLLRDIKTIIKEIRDAQVYKPRRYRN